MGRKQTVFSLLLGFSLVLAGCTAPASTAQPSPTPAQSSEAAVTAAPAPEVTTAPENQLVFSQSAAGARTADGFYTVHTYDDWTGCLVFYDYASRQAVPVCSQPNCEHHDETCPAWFGDKGNIPRLLTNGEQLVLCYLNTPARIETANPDGSNRRVLYEFAANATPGDGLCMDEDGVYLLSTSVSDEADSRQDLLRIDLADGSCNPLWSGSTTGGSYAFLAGCRDHYLVLKEIRRNTQQAETAEQLADQTHTLLSVDPRDGSTAPLYAWQQGDLLESALPDTLYGITADHRLCAFAGDEQLTELARDDRFVPSVTVIQYADEDALWFTAPENGTEGKSSLYQLNLADGTIAPVPLAQGRSLTVLGETGNDLFVRITADDSLQASLDTRYALVPKDRMTTAQDDSALEEFTELF